MLPLRIAQRDAEPVEDRAHDRRRKRKIIGRTIVRLAPNLSARLAFEHTHGHEIARTAALHRAIDDAAGAQLARDIGNCGSSLHKE